MTASAALKSWVIAPLGDICVRKIEQREPGEDAVPYIDIGSINRDTKAIGELQHVTRANSPTRARQSVRAGDVLVSMTRPNLNAVALVPRHLDGAIASTGFDVLRPIEVLPEWVFNRVRSDDFVASVSEGLQGVVYPAIRPHDVRNHECPIPPLPEQRRIVEAIESYFTRLDDAVAALERAQRNLKRYRASVLKAAVEGRLVPTEAVLARAEGGDYEPASALLERILAERRRGWQETGGRGKYQEPVAPDATDLSDLPDGWCWATMDALTLSGSQNGLYVPKSHYGAGVPILRIDDYQADWSSSSNELQRVNISEADAAKYGLAVGDLVINRVNSPSHLGKSLAVLERHVPAVFESNMMRLAIASGVLPAFIQHYLSSTLGKMRLTKNAKWAVNQASINQRDVGRTAVPLPPVSEQRRIVTEIDRLLSTASAMADISRTGAGRCVRLRQGILKWAFEGRLANQDPSDEPASVLLERIRTETATRAISAPTGAPPSTADEQVQ